MALWRENRVRIPAAQRRALGGVPPRQVVEFGTESSMVTEIRHHAALVYVRAARW
jgi:hypothetical protein